MKNCLSYSYSYSCFSSFSFSISHSCFMNTSIHFAFPILFLFHAYYIWHSIHLYNMMLMYSHSFVYSCPSTNLFYLEIGIIPIGSSKLKLWNFHAKLVNLPILPEGQFVILIFQCLDSIFDTCSFYSFKAKVLRVLLQLESPNRSTETRVMS